MEMYAISKDALEDIADSIRTVTGFTRRMTPKEMVEEIKNILNATTFILVDKDGNEYPAIYVESDAVFTATENDIRKGYTAATGEGIITGTKEIPAYHTSEGYGIIQSGKAFSIPFSDDKYDFTKLQAIICPWIGSFGQSVAAEKVVLDENVYAVNSNESIAVISRNDETRSIDLGIVNDSENVYLIRYFTYKEVP